MDDNWRSPVDDSSHWWERLLFRLRPRSRDWRDHQYHDCPGCGARLVQARTFQQSYRFFDAEPVDILPMAPPVHSRGSENFNEVMAVKFGNDERRRLNAQLWFFDPWQKGAMVPYWRQHVTAGKGLREHFCALGIEAPPVSLNEGERVPWRTPRPSLRSSAA